MKASNQHDRRADVDSELREILDADSRVVDMAQAHRALRERQHERATQNMSVHVAQSLTRNKRRPTVALIAIPALAACLALAVLLPALQTNDVRRDNAPLDAVAATAVPSQMPNHPAADAAHTMPAPSTVQPVMLAAPRQRNAHDAGSTAQAEAVLLDLATEQIVDQLTTELHDAGSIVPLTTHDIDHLLAGI